MGLREAKKRRVRASIIENAVALFRDRGFEAATVREIAAGCEISEATFFNYFPTKGAVLSAWAHGTVERCLEAAPADRGVRPALRSLCDALAAEIEPDRDFAGRAWLRARLPVAPPAAAVRIAKAGQDDGRLRRDLGDRQLGGILYVSICGAIADWLAREEPRGPLGPELRRATDLVLDGARRRNERVRPAPRQPAAAP